MRNYRRFRGLYFEEISVDGIEVSSLGVHGWADACNVIPSGFDLMGTGWKPMIEYVGRVATTTLKTKNRGRVIHAWDGPVFGNPDLSRRGSKTYVVITIHLYLWRLRRFT